MYKILIVEDDQTNSKLIAEYLEKWEYTAKVATVLIIYYKQITEGYEDKERFRILQDVGMSKKEVSQTIRSQVLFVFFLPLLTVITHILVAFPLVNKLLLSMNLDNTKLFLSSTGIVIVILAFLYTVVYRWTARIYYRIVN